MDMRIYRVQFCFPKSFSLLTLARLPDPTCGTLASSSALLSSSRNHLPISMPYALCLPLLQRGGSSHMICYHPMSCMHALYPNSQFSASFPGPRPSVDVGPVPFVVVLRRFGGCLTSTSTFIRIFPFHVALQSIHFIKALNSFSTFFLFVHLFCPTLVP